MKLLHDWARGYKDAADRAGGYDDINTVVFGDRRDAESVFMAAVHAVPVLVPCPLPSIRYVCSLWGVTLWVYLDTDPLPNNKTGRSAPGSRHWSTPCPAVPLTLLVPGS